LHRLSAGELRFFGNWEKTRMNKPVGWPAGAGDIVTTGGAEGLDAALIDEENTFTNYSVLENTGGDPANKLGRSDDAKVLYAGYARLVSPEPGAITPSLRGLPHLTQTGPLGPEASRQEGDRIPGLGGMPPGQAIEQKLGLKGVGYARVLADAREKIPPILAQIHSAYPDHDVELYSAYGFKDSAGAIHPAFVLDIIDKDRHLVRRLSIALERFGGTPLDDTNSRGGTPQRATEPPRGEGHLDDK
jgi:hypothetical protein